MTERRNRQEADAKRPLVLIVGGHEPARAVGSAPIRAGVRGAPVGAGRGRGRCRPRGRPRAHVDRLAQPRGRARRDHGHPAALAPRWWARLRLCSAVAVLLPRGRYVRLAGPLGSTVDVPQRRTLGVGVRLNRGAWESRWRDAVGSDTQRRRSQLDLTAEWRQQRTETRVVPRDERDLRRPLRRRRLRVGLPAGRRLPHIRVIVLMHGLLARRVPVGLDGGRHRERYPASTRRRSGDHPDRRMRCPLAETKYVSPSSRRVVVTITQTSVIAARRCP